jgi:NTP pyrophosphatase (non-canonical NTP hydrolase)
MFFGLRLAEETGEVIGVVKRHSFRRPGKPLDEKEKSALEDEMGDVLHSLAQLAESAGLSLSQIAYQSLLKQAAKGRGALDHL